MNARSLTSRDHQRFRPPYFDEKRNRVITYAEVEAGDKIRGRAIYGQAPAMSRANSKRFWSQSLDQPPEVIELTLDGTASKPLQIAARNVEHGENDPATGSSITSTSSTIYPSEAQLTSATSIGRSVSKPAASPTIRLWRPR